MYLRRHDYNKTHRCPGWSGAGWGGTYYDEKPDDWDTDVNEDGKYPFETSNSRRTKWWQRRHRCEGGRIWTRDLQDPWHAFRFGRCNKCDVRTLPLVTRWFDPTYWRFHFGWKLRQKFENIAWHKNRWMDPPGAPWWSLPDTLWKEFGWPGIKYWFFDKGITVRCWWADFRVWINPETRKADRKEVMDHFGVSK